VGTDDGRIKVVGTACLECTLTSPSKTATASLHVLANTGCFLRLDACGKSKHLFTLEATGGDTITSCCPLAHTPFVFVGCASGTFRTVGLMDATGELVGPARPVESMRWMGLTMSPDELEVSEDSELQEIQCMHSSEDDVRVLLRHEYNTVTLVSVSSKLVRGSVSRLSKVTRTKRRFRRDAAPACTARRTPLCPFCLLRERSGAKTCALACGAAHSEARDERK
jgi:hypothetical protein